jgi:hypothetical protein
MNSANDSDPNSTPVPIGLCHPPRSAMWRITSRCRAVPYGSCRPETVIGDLLRIFPADLPWMTGVQPATSSPLCLDRLFLPFTTDLFGGSLNAGKGSIFSPSSSHRSDCIRYHDRPSSVSTKGNLPTRLRFTYRRTEISTRDNPRLLLARRNKRLSPLFPCHKFARLLMRP